MTTVVPWRSPTLRAATPPGSHYRLAVSLAHGLDLTFRDLASDAQLELLEAAQELIARFGDAPRCR